MTKRSFRIRTPLPASADSVSPPVVNRGGRPPYYDTPEEMQVAIDAYVQRVRADKSGKEHVSWAGLVYDLGFASRDALDVYAARDERFTDTVKRARLFVEYAYSNTLMHKDTVVGSIFALKQFGWTDKSEVESKTLTANVDFTRLSDSQLRRIQAGENLLQVLSEPGSALPPLPPALTTPNNLKQLTAGGGAAPAPAVPAASPVAARRPRRPNAKGKQR